MVFFKLLLPAVGLYLLYSLFCGSDRDRPPPPPPPPPPYRPSPVRSPSPRRDPRGSTQPTYQRANAGQPLVSQRRPVENVTEHQRLSHRNLAQHAFSSTEDYRSQDHQYLKIESIRNAQLSNEDDDERDPHYCHLRSQAGRYYDLMGKSFEESKKAYNQGDRALAKQLSVKGHEYRSHMESFNKKASEWIFNQNNKDNGPCNVDLHRLHVQEAISKTEQVINDARVRGDPSIRLIVGKGIHSKNGTARLKPRIEKFIRESGFSLMTEPRNEGVLIVNLNPVHPESGGNEYFRDRTNYLFA